MQTLISIVSLVGSIFAIITSCIGLFKMVVTLNVNLTRMSCSIDNHTEKIGQVVGRIDSIEEKLDDLTVKVAKLTK